MTEAAELNRQDLASALRVSDSTIARWLRAGLPHTPVGVRGKRFNLAEVRAWLREVYQPCQSGQTSKGAATSASWSMAGAFTESSRKVHLRVMPSASRAS